MSEKYLNASRELFQPVHVRPRNGKHKLQSSGRSLTEYGCSTSLSVPGENSSLRLFQLPVTDVSIVKSKWVGLWTFSNWSQRYWICHQAFIRLHRHQQKELRLVIKNTKNNGGNIAPGKKYTLINNALHSLIKQFTINLNKILITEQSDTQAYNAYIKPLLNFTEQAKKSFLTKALYYKDTSGHMELIILQKITGDSWGEVPLLTEVLKYDWLVYPSAICLKLISSSGQHGNQDQGWSKQ